MRTAKLILLCVFINNIYNFKIYYLEIYIYIYSGYIGYKNISIRNGSYIPYVILTVIRTFSSTPDDVLIIGFICR